MKLNKKHYAILKTLAIAAKEGKELRGVEISEQTRIPFFVFWERDIGFSEVYPLLTDLVKAGLVVGRSDIGEAAITAPYPRYYKIAS